MSWHFLYILFLVMTYVLTSWHTSILLTSWRTFWCHVMTSYNIECTSWRTFWHDDVLFNIMTHFPYFCWWRTSWSIEVHFDFMTYFWGHDVLNVFYYSMTYLLRHDVIFDVMIYVLRHDVVFDIITYFLYILTLYGVLFDGLAYFRT